MVKAYWACKDIGAQGNMGDVLTRYILEKVAGEVSFADDLSEPHFFLSGSILREARDATTVIGAGFNGLEQSFSTTPRILAVRGPLSRNQLPDRYRGLPLVLGDPALVLPLLFRPSVEPVYDLGIVPHYIDAGNRAISRFVRKYNQAINVIDILSGVEPVVTEICKCRAVLSSTLHGLIVAHAYGIPALWVEFSDKVVGGRYKFHDYFYSIGVAARDPLNCRQRIPVTVLGAAPPAPFWDRLAALRFLDIIQKEAVGAGSLDIDHRNL